MPNIRESLLNGMNELLTAPSKDPSIWWLLTPIILFWIILEIYFGKYKNEKLGWNTALGNGLNMFWVVVISSKAIFTKSLGLFSLDKVLFIAFIAIYSIFIIIISFTHRIKEGLFYLLASPTVVYYLSAIAVLWIHDLFTFTLWTLIDIIILYIAVLIFETILKKLIPAASPKEEHTEFHLGKA